METRKVQVTGGATYVISLPKRWVREAGIKRNDSLGIIQQPDGNLMVTPSLTGVHEQKRKQLDVEETEVPEHLLRKLIGAYMMGYDLIEVRSEGDMPAQTRDALRRFTQMAIGPEIIEESASKVLTKDLLDPTDLPLESSVRRMYYIVRAMLNDAFRALKDMDTDLALDLQSRDNEVDRLNWLVARQFHMMIRDLRLVEKFGTTRERGVAFLQMSRILERIADHACRVAENITVLEGETPEPKTVEKLLGLGRDGVDILEGSMDAFFKKDLEALNERIDSVGRMLKRCDGVAKRIPSEGVEIAVPVSYILDSIQRIAMYARDISEIGINYLVEIEV